MTDSFEWRGHRFEWQHGFRRFRSSSRRFDARVTRKKQSWAAEVAWSLWKGCAMEVFGRGPTPIAALDAAAANGAELGRIAGGE